MAEITHFEGQCSVCGGLIAFDYDPASGPIDFDIRDGKMITWVRHYATAPPEANPDCDLYSSEVVEKSKEREAEHQ